MPRGLPAPSTANNDHYATAETNGVDLMRRAEGDHAVGVYGTAGRGDRGPHHHVRRAPRAFFINGTNRAMFRFTMINHMCHDMETVQDTTRPPDRIRQDVARSPGGDSRIFLNNCVGCHSGMDPMAQAFAYYNFDGTAGTSSMYTAGQVQPKYFINSTQLRARASSRRTTAGRTAGARAPTRCSAGSERCPAAATAPSRSARSSPAAMRSPQCQVQKVFQAVCFAHAGTRRRPRAVAQPRRPSKRTATSSSRCSQQVAAVLHGPVRGAP